MEIKINPDEQPDIPSYFGKLNFLIVDDEEFNLYMLKNILKKWGVSFSEAQNGKEATELALKNSFDLILMDLRMPVMDGYEAANSILKDRPFSKIIALTGTVKPDDLQKNSQSGILFFLQKPFTESALFNAVIQLLRNEYPEKDDPASEKRPPVDLGDLERMTGGDKAFFNEMLKIFIRSSENGLATIQRNFETSDWDAIAEAAHKLAAPANHLNASTLYSNLKTLEHEAENSKDIDKIKSLILQIKQEISHINIFLNKKLSGE